MSKVGRLVIERHRSCSLNGMASKPRKATRIAAHHDSEQATRTHEKAVPPAARDRMSDDEDPAEFDDPLAGSADREPGGDDPRQRPLTDNKAGG